MSSPSLTEIEQAFSIDLCADDDLPFWTAGNPSRGHRAIAALIAGVEIDLTSNQFLPNEVVNAPEAVARPPGRPRHYAEQYDTFRARVGDVLGIEIRPSGMWAD